MRTFLISFFIAFLTSFSASGRSVKWFELSPKAIQTFGIQSLPTPREGFYIRLSAKTTVDSLTKKEIFIRQGNQFKSIEVSIVKTDGQSYLALPKEETGNGELVVEGQNFLKTIELSVKEDASEGHGQ